MVKVPECQGSKPNLSKFFVEELNIFLTVSRATRPMAPNRINDNHLSNTWLHVGHLNLRIFRSRVILTRRPRYLSKKTYGKYKSVLPGKTSVFALMACMAALKSPLYGSCFEQSPDCQVYNITSKFSGSKRRQLFDSTWLR